MDRIKKEDLITGDMLHCQYMDVNDLVRILNQLNNEIKELRNKGKNDKNN